MNTTAFLVPGTVSKLAGVHQAFADLTLLLDSDGSILEWRFDDLRLHDRFPTLIHNRKIQELISPESALRLADLLMRARNSEATQAFEFSIVSPYERWFEGRIVVLSETQFLLFARDITNRKRTEHRLAQQASRLAALRSVDLAIASGLDLKLLLSMLLKQLIDILQVDAASILLLNPETNLLAFSAGVGFRKEILQHSRLKLGDEIAGRVALERKAFSSPDLRMNAMGYKRPSDFVEEQFVAYHGLPLLAKGKTLGVLQIFNRSPLQLDLDSTEFLSVVAGQAAIAIDNANMFRDLQRSNVELSLAYDATIEGWSRTLGLRDQETEEHTRRLVEMTTRLALMMGVEQNSLIHIRRGVILHDIGKVAIPDEILLKPGPLTEEEWQIMRRHPSIAANLLAPISYLAPALDIPRWHHERWDGNGYPDRLTGEQIPFPARLFSVADVYDALTSNRPYRSAWSKSDAIRYIEDQSGKYFDPRVVVEFMKLVNGNGYAALH